MMRQRCYTYMRIGNKCNSLLYRRYKLQQRGIIDMKLSLNISNQQQPRSSDPETEFLWIEISLALELQI